MYIHVFRFIIYHTKCQQVAKGQRSLTCESTSTVTGQSVDLIKIEDAGVATTLKIDFSNIQGQLTPQSRVESGSNSNSSKM